MKYITPGFFSALLLLSVAGCDFNAAKDAFDQFDLIIALDEIDTVVATDIIDAETGNYVSGRTAIFFMGDDAESVVDMFNDPIQWQKVKGGLTSFGISNGVAPSESNPITFRVIAVADGYSTGIAQVTVRGTGTTDVVISMQKRNMVPDASAWGSGSQDVGTSGGVVQTTTTIQTTQTPTGTKASFTIPMGAEATTTNGTPVQGPITTNMSFFQASQQTGAVPLGTGSVARVEGQDGGEDGTLEIMAAASVTLSDQSGNGIDYLGSPVEISMELDANAINPKTGVPFQQGDELDMFVFDPVPAIWRYAGTSTASFDAGKGPGSSTQFQNEFWWFGTPNPDPPEHVAFFEFTPLVLVPDFIRPMYSWFDDLIDFQPCILGLSLRIGPDGTISTDRTGCGMTVSYGNQVESCSVRAILTNNVSGGYVSVKEFTGANPLADIGPFAFQGGQTSISIDGLPRPSPSSSATLEFTANDGTASESISLPGDCGATKAIVLPTPPASIDVTFDLQISSSQFTCPSGALRIANDLPAFVIKYKKQGESDVSALTVPDGGRSFTTDAQNRITGGTLLVPDLVQGQTYTFSTTINGNREQRDITITGTNQAFDISEDVQSADICAGS